MADFSMRMLDNTIPPLIITLLSGALMWALSLLPPHFEIAISVRLLAATGIALPGGVFCLAGFVSFRRAKTTINPHKPGNATKLVTSGIYRISRNPMYASLALFLAAWAAYVASPWSPAGLAAFILYMNRFQIAPEERALAKLFGADYEDYASRVRRWL
jgi:protein-S-isoprenylcysteine O-methyltransferase Ste14